MDKNKEKNQQQARRHARVRSKVIGTAIRPRLSVFRSNSGMFLQIIDDSAGKTIVSASSAEVKAKGKKIEISKELGKMIAEKAAAKNIKAVVFDRGAYQYHGRVQAVAEGAREGGLEF